MKFLILSFLITSSSIAAMVIDEANLGALVDRNPNVQSLLNRLESSERLKGRLTRSFLPKVSLSYGREKFTTGPYYNQNQPFGGVQAELNLFNSGKDKIENEIRENNSEIARIDVTLLRAQVMAELKKSLSHFAYLTEIKKITSEALLQNEINLRNAQKRIDAGLATSTDLLDFKQQEVQFNQELGALDYELGVTYRLINILLGNEPENAVELSFTNGHPDHEKEAQVSVAGKSLIVQKAELFKEVVKLELKQDQRWWAPSLDIFGYAQRFTQKEREYVPGDARNDVTFGLKFTFPIFDGGEGYRGAQATKALVEAQKGQVRSQVLQLHKETLDAVKKLELAHDLIHGSEENVEIMNKYRRGILNEYTKGVKNSPDVLQASQRWIEAKIRNAEVRKNYQFAKAEVSYLASLQGEN